MSGLADSSLRPLVLIWVYTLTRSATTVSLVGLAEALPLLALAPFAGVFVDRWSRARTMAGAVSVRAVVILPLLLVTTGAGVPLIVVVVLGANAASQFFQPAVSAALPVIVGPERVGRANSLFTLVTGVSAAIGPAGAAALFVVIGPHATVVALSLIYALAVPLLLAVPAPRPTTRGAPRTSVPRELRDGLAYVHRSPLLLALIVVVFVALLGVGALSVIDVVFVTRALHRPVANAGVLLLANGTGQILGGLLVALTSAWATHRYHRLLGGAPRPARRSAWWARHPIRLSPGAGSDASSTRPKPWTKDPTPVSSSPRGPTRPWLSTIGTLIAVRPNAGSRISSAPASPTA